MQFALYVSGFAALGLLSLATLFYAMTGTSDGDEGNAFLVIFFGMPGAICALAWFGLIVIKAAIS